MSAAPEPGLPPRRDAALIARAQLGDLSALDRLLASIQAPLFAHITTFVGDPDQAADVLQDALLAISRKLPSLRDPRWFRAWAYRIATRLSIRAARRSRRHDEMMDADALPDVAVADEELRLDPADVDALHAALDAVPQGSQVVLRMHYLHGLTHVEIAEALEISPGTVKSRLHYGLTWLRRRLSPA